MLRSLKAAVKTVGAGVMYHSGALGALPRPPLTVLGYHRVLDVRMPDLTHSPLGMVTTVAMFERQLAYAARHYRMVSLQDIEDATEGRRPLPPRAAFVTFDDGWEDNYRVAYPILRRMGIPAAVFVATDYMSTSRSFWFTTLMRSLLEGRRRVRPGEGRELGWPADVAGELDRLARLPQPLRPWQLDPLVEMMKRHPEPAIDTMVESLATRLYGGVPNGDRSFLTWDEIREMDRGGIGIGSHTCSHRILTLLPPDEAADELRRSREKLEKELGHPVTSFAYPNGAYDASHMAMAWDVGYRTFFVSSRLRPGGVPGHVYPRPCLHDRVGQGFGDRFYPSILELHLTGVGDRVRYFAGIYK